MKQVRSLRVLTALGLTLLLVAFGGTAVAHWASAGSGTGATGTGTALNVTLSPATPSAQLYPGGQAAVTLTITNPNLAIVTVGSLALDTSRGAGGFAVDAGHSGCATSALGFTTQDNSGAGWNVPARVGAVDGSLALSLPMALTMGTDAANACQGATFTIYLSAGP